MHTKFNNYTNELNEIVKILNNFPPIHTISSKELQKYKCLIARKEHLQKKINILLNKRTKIIEKYNNKNNIWLSSNMNCRKYYKLEQSAAYSRDYSLYKIGFLDSKPTLPVIANTKLLFQEKFYEPLSEKLSFIKNKIKSYFVSTSKKSPICKEIKKSKDFIHNDLPVILTNKAVEGTKKCIVSYRKLSSSINNSIKVFSRNVSQSPSVKTLSFIINKAKQEANMQQNPFLARIKINPNTLNYHTLASGNNAHPKIKIHNTGCISQKNNSKNTQHASFDLAL